MNYEGFGFAITSSLKLKNMDSFLASVKDASGVAIEVGTFQGGSLKYLAERHPYRQFIGYDTFVGLMQETEKDNVHKIGHFSNTSLESVQKVLEGLPNIRLVQGVYPVCEIAPPGEIVLAHIDVDLYEATLSSLEHIATSMVKGGRIYCDDAFVPTCFGATLAMAEFCSNASLKLRLERGNHAFIEF